MTRKLILILGLLGVSMTTLTGCVADSGYGYYGVGSVTVYREVVVVERPRSYRRTLPPYAYYRARNHRSPRCFGANCYVGATYREDPYYQLSD